MALTVGTNTYISVSDADLYCLEMGKTAWEAANETAKEAALRQATLYLDTYFRWTGFLQDSTQLLGWPRTSAKDAEGRTLSGIPTKVAQACAELAVLALGGPLAPMSLPSTTGRVKRKRLGQADYEYDFSGIPAGRHAYDQVVAMLRGIGTFKTNNGGTVPTIRT